MLEPQALTARPTFQLLSTLFIATSKYASSVEDLDQRNKTYRSIALNFYEPMLQVLTRSLFSYYTTTDENGHLFLNEKAINNEGKIRIPRELIRDYKAIDNTTRGVLAEIQPAYLGENDIKVFTSIKQSTLRIRAFAGILADDIYRTYQLSPYLSVEDYGVFLPQLSDDNSSVVVDTELINTETPATEAQPDASSSSQSPAESNTVTPATEVQSRETQPSSVATPNAENSPQLPTQTEVTQPVN